MAHTGSADVRICGHVSSEGVTIAVTQADPQLADYQEQQRIEYNTWVAAQDINSGNARAFNAGDPVPKSTVERLKLDELGMVVLRDSDEGRALFEPREVDADEAMRNDVMAQAPIVPGTSMGTASERASRVHEVPESEPEPAPKAATTKAKGGNG